MNQETIEEAIIRLRREEGMFVAEIADVLHCSNLTVRHVIDAQKRNVRFASGRLAGQPLVKPGVNTANQISR